MQRAAGQGLAGKRDLTTGNIHRNIWTLAEISYKISEFPVSISKSDISISCVHTPIHENENALFR